MNIIDALRTGQPIRRAGKTTWTHIDTHGHAAYSTTSENAYVEPTYFLDTFKLASVDILAEDWEVQPKEITITLDEHKFHQMIREEIEKEMLDDRLTFIAGHPSVAVDKVVRGAVIRWWKRISGGAVVLVLLAVTSCVTHTAVAPGCETYPEIVGGSPETREEDLAVLNRAVDTCRRQGSCLVRVIRIEAQRYHAICRRS